MDGVAGVAGWRWIFLMEVSKVCLVTMRYLTDSQGIITIILGVVTAFALADTPENATRWLSADERKYLSLRMTQQEGGAKIQKASRHFSWGLLWSVVSDWQFYLMVFNYWSNTVPTYGLKFTMPQIMKK